MKKTGSILLVILILALLAAPAAFASGDAADGPDYVSDWAYLLSDSQWRELESKAAVISERYQCGVYVFTVEDMYDFNVNYKFDDGDAYVFNKAIYEEYRLGYGQDRSCLILCLSTDDRDYWLEPYGFARTAFNSYGIDSMLDGSILPKLKANDYYGAFSGYLDIADEYLRLARAGAPFSRETDPVAIRRAFRWHLGVTILLPLLIAWIVCSVWKRQMKTAVLASAADSYIPQGGFKLTGQSDAFLYRTTTRIKIQKASSSSGSSSSGSSGRGGKY